MRTLFSLALLGACSDYDLTGKDENPDGGQDSGGTDTRDTDGGSSCELRDFPAEAVPANDACDFEIGGFEPVIEWSVPGKWSTALPVVGDLDGDGLPEIVAIWSGIFTSGTIEAWHGDGSGKLWDNPSIDVGYGSGSALADLDDDGWAEVIVCLDKGFGAGMAIGALEGSTGELLWESETYTDGEFNYATGIAVSDMDHDGSPEIIAGRVILNADGTQRAEGRGDGIGASAGFGALLEGAHPAVADLDLDGEEEVITGSHIYDIDGNAIVRTGEVDGAVSVANLDSDPEGEFVVTNGNSVRAHDTDGSLLWGPTVNPSANIFPVAAIGDIDGDGMPEIIVAGGNEIWALNHDGTPLWDNRVTDETGATGASIFDFDGDGVPEVVYIDEVEMVAYNGADGVVKFLSREHASVTMYDYPVIADLDGDGHTEIVVANQGDDGITIYQDATNSWAPSRAVWNQHAYTITNINDDLSVPVTAIPNFTLYNSYHSALPTVGGEALGNELEAEILDVCADDCDSGTLRVWGRGRNSGNGDLEAGIQISLYGTPDDVLLGTAVTTAITPALMSTESVEFVVDTALLDGVTGLELRVDDDGTGTGLIAECVETNNGFAEAGSWCD
ncbi:MAG: VCBS repeat-containing protein [Pseudomonadota bacterium]|nr:VCBS repeat-containing protein [Pseudomonadota bacterium]